jgi:NTE family protein
MSRPLFDLHVVNSMTVIIALSAIALLGTPDNSGVALAQEPDAGRPKIGLVLAGGGARGASHVGVLKVLERERIPIDYVAGTSMGSIVGGMYAAGMSPEEIELQMAAVDWEGVFHDKVEREDRSYRRKTDDRLWLYGIKPGYSDGQIKLPPGLVQGQKIGLLLSSLILPVAEIENFDDLPIPFRAIAADIQTGEKVALDSGNLAKAIRASMAVPAALSPVPWDGRRLVDGGIASNLPVQTVKDMGADIIIAVDLGEPLSEHELGESLLSIVDQLTAMLVRDNVERELAMLTDEDVLILPDLGDITSAQFDRVIEAIPTGVVAAELKLDELRELALSEANYEEHVSARRKPRTEMPVIEFLTFDNNSAVSDDFLLGRLQTAMRGDPIVGQTLDVDRLEQAINELYALDIFAHVVYELVEEDGRYGIHINALKKGWGPNYIQIGAKWNSSMNGNGILSVALSYMKTEMNAWNAEWRTTAAVGEEPGLHTDFFQPLGKGADWFAGAALLAQQFNINIFDEGSNDITEQVRIQRLGATIYTGREFGNWGRAWVGMTRGGGDRSISIGDPSTPDQDFDIGEATFTLEADKLDSLYFSRHGHSALASYRFSDKGLGASENFEQVVFSGRFVRSFGRHTWTAYGDYKSTISGVAPPERLFRAGGLFNLSGFEYNQLSGQNFTQVGAAYRRDFLNLGPLQLSAGMSLELGNVWQNRSDMDFDNALFGGSLFLGSNTPIGPLYFGWGISEKSDGTFYVSLGAVRNDPVLQ